MRRLLALTITIAIVWLVVVVPAGDGDGLRVTALALGFALIAAALAGALLERFGLPRVTGYLLFGMVCGPYVANIITRPMARELQLINGLAVVLIAFIAGLEMNVARMRPRLRAILQLGGIGIVALYAGLFAAFWFAWPWIGIAPGLTGIQRAAVAAILTTLVASFSPTVTIALITESRASGPLSELTLAVVILADLVLILLFTLVMQFVRFAFGGAAEVGLFVSVTWEIFGSFAFGAVIGALFAFYLRHVGREVPIALLGVCMLITGLGHELHLEPLLAALAAGLVVENIAPPRGDMLKDAVERGALPVLVVFFAAAGASLQLDALAVIGGVALAVALLRAFLIWSSMRVGAKYARIPEPVGGLVWMGLISQAGVTLGLTLIVAGEQPTWGTTIQTLVVALIALHQLAGPVLFRAALAKAGEIGKMDADSAPDAALEPTLSRETEDYGRLT
jgi:Kef-type K+ transport system membrane component KefB